MVERWRVCLPVVMLALLYKALMLNQLLGQSAGADGFCVGSTIVGGRSGARYEFFSSI